MSEISPEILDKITKVCICKSISRKVIKDAINNGLHTLEEIQKHLGAGSGSCSGRRCTPKIIELLKEMLRKD